ncbi:SelT/SelW/SelH family protein [Nocardioides bruguierae]|uniref:SelT/SelW/SelH family protein n=1 Tax=Nocardioides bruguierae TaxID=2945102 RepID=A0A9X2D6S9_9ACTN|nr:SelT/SelW/SelH family protein [Nocardioides bruguierae]MCL8025112.1 SelT/SelW/SelH family protein [Nocardioides bruguierae]MCM0620074.1 SelT/SelW/SelH family protein [Nocardioides bruguierae]
MDATAVPDPTTSRPRVEIRYCTRCRWLLRAQWYAAELLQTFETDLGEVALLPASTEAEAGVFRVDVDGTPVWNRKRDGGFPEITELKRRVRDLVAPDRPLGHADRAAH